ncbi:MAG: hypothetical protein AB8G11_21965 [Saprospiraceae bacterium]
MLKLSVKYFLATTFLLMSIIPTTFGQTKGNQEDDLPKIDENMFMETRWKYTKTYHVSSETDIHEASEGYKFFVYFQYDYDYQTYLNGTLDKGNWLIDSKGSEIYFQFRNMSWWKVVKVDKKNLELEFKIGNGVFRYVFVNATKDETNFFDGEELNIEGFADIESKDEEAPKKKEKPKKKMDDITPKAPPAIEVQLVGGGYFGGIDPVLKDYIHLKPNGRLVREIETMQKGLNKSSKEIPREDMEKLVKFIETKGFFELDNTYDCTSGTCQSRKKAKPTPVPLTLVVRHGSKRKVVVITIYGRDGKRGKYVNYPPEIDIIIENIRLLANE